MMIVKKFTKDVQDLSTNKIFKRNLWLVKSINNCETKKVLEEVGISKADAKQISTHPIVAAEKKNGDYYITNLTSSKYVEGEKTV